MVERLTQGDIDALTIRSSRLLRKKRGGIRNFGSVPIGCIPSRCYSLSAYSIVATATFWRFKTVQALPC